MALQTEPLAGRRTRLGPAPQRPSPVPAASSNGSGARRPATRRPRLAVLAIVLAFDLVAVAVGVVVASPGWPGALLALAIVLPSVASADTNGKLVLSALDDLPWLVGRVGLALLPAAALGWALDSTHDVLVQAVVTAVALPPARAYAYSLVRHARRCRLLTERTVIVGVGPLAVEIERILAGHPDFGLEVVGFVDHKNARFEGTLLGDLSELPAVLERWGASRVIVAFGAGKEPEMVEALRALTTAPVEVHVVPRFFDVGVAPTGPDVDDLRGIPLYHLRRAGGRLPSWRAKRAADVVLASICLVVMLPVMLVLALAIRAGSAGGALFSQKRIGQGGREFRMLKLRSLRVRSTPLVEPETAESADIQAARRQDVENRRTRVGELVRRTGLDEVPQLWNVMMGDMSLVGPRPEECRFAEHFAETVHGYRDRHRLPGGLTGWAQVNGLRGQTSIAERARFDNHYIEHWSLWRDVVIILRTAGAMVRSIIDRPGGTPEPVATDGRTPPT